MAKIQCPHCKAMNQDVSLDDPCWQCGMVLNAPPSAIETGHGPATSEANPANAQGSSSGPIQAQIDREQGRDRAPQRQKTARRMNVAAIVIAAAIIVVFVLLVVIVLNLKR